ncbi:hypothetical protein QQF64_030524 [Cirrhinus molitorella]|uniref:Phospholipid scramblase n=1 Tax=Cirrhinus molitorella TaxID=172907 RepID=A0ABR3N3X0_9TELE
MSEPGYPPQNDLPNPMPQSEGPGQALPATEFQTDDQLPQPPLYESEPLYEVVQEFDEEEHTYMCPDPVTPPAVLQLENQPPVVDSQPVMNLSPITAVPYLIEQYKGPDLVTPSAVLQLQNQPPVVDSQPVMNLSPITAVPYLIEPYKGYPVQSYLPNAIPQTSGPGPVSPPAVLQLQSHPLPVQTVMNLSSNPAPHQLQPYTGCPPQIHQPNPMPQREGTALDPPAVELQSENQPTPVLNQSDPSNPAPHQGQPYAAPAVPPPVLLYGVPPGLEYLTQIDQILIHQKTECIKILSRFESDNQYEIKNSIGQEIYHAKEESDCFIRNIFGPARAFKMHIKDHMDQEVIQMHRPMRCFLSELEVQAPPGVTIGYVKHEWSFLPKFSILGPSNEMLLTINGPFIPFKCCDDIDFEVIGLVGEQIVGRITKQQSGLVKKCLSDASNFCIQFPMDMDVKMKAVLLGACILIDILFFDKGGHLILKFLKGL